MVYGIQTKAKELLVRDALEAFECSAVKRRRFQGRSVVGEGVGEFISEVDLGFIRRMSCG